MYVLLFIFLKLERLKNLSKLSILKNFLSKKEFKNLAYSLIIIFFGWIIYCYITNSNLIDNLFQPLQLALHLKITSEFPYGFSFLKHLFHDFKHIEHLASLFSILFSFILLLLINKLKEEDRKIFQKKNNPPIYFLTGIENIKF